MSDLPKPTTLSGRRLLVVEDEFLIADELCDQLTGAGAEVIGPVPTLDKAFRLVEANTALDAAILDVNLCGQKIFPLVDLLRQRGIPCVFVTGYDRGAIPAAYADIPMCEKPARAIEIAQALPMI